MKSKLTESKKDFSIATIVVTRNRPDKLKNCLLSISKNTVLPDEFLVINEGSEPLKIGQIKISNLNIKIINLPVKNLSLGRNTGIFNVNSDIICFTDDDCVVTNSWISNILRSFKDYPQCEGVFGNIRPYLKSKIERGFCPCTFALQTASVISKPRPHMTHIGFGNNMAFRSSAFKQFETFKTWLSVGSVGRSAEDAEFALRILIKGGKLLHSPKVVVYHDRWLSETERLKQNLLYGCGETASYGYFAFQGHKFAYKVLKSSFRELYFRTRGVVASIVKLRLDKQFVENLTVLVKLTISLLRGLIIGLWFSIVDPVNKVSVKN